MDQECFGGSVSKGQLDSAVFWGQHLHPTSLQVIFSLVYAFGMTFNTTYTTNILPAPSPLLFKPYINQIAHRPNVKPTIKTIDASGKHVMNTSKMTLTSTIVHDHQREDNAIMTMQ